MTHESQRMKRALQVVAPPAVEGGPTRLRFQPCFTCQTYAASGCLRDGHLVGLPEDVLPPLKLVNESARSA